jgi:hypothetical protein
MAMAAGEGPTGPVGKLLEEGRGEEIELRCGPMEEDVEFELRAISETGDASISASVSAFS